MIIEVISAFFGPIHARMFCEVLLPSLEQASNLPALRKAGHTVVHRIYCTTDDLQGLPNFDYIYNTDLLTDCPPIWRRDRIHVAIKEAIGRGNLAIIASPDHVFGNGLAAAVEGLKAGEYLVCPHPRIDLETAIDLIPHFLPFKPTNDAWVDFFMDAVPHRIVQVGMANKNPYWRTFERADHWETYFQEPPPLAFIGTPDMLDAWLPENNAHLEVIDHELVDYCFRRGRLKSIMDSRIFCWAELTPRDAYTNGIPARFEHLASAQHFNRTPARWYFK